MWHLRHNSQPNTFRKTTKVTEPRGLNSEIEIESEVVRCFFRFFIPLIIGAIVITLTNICFRLLRVVFTYFTYFNGTIVFTSFNRTIVFALAYTSARRYLRVIFTYFADLEDHAQIKQSEPSHCADHIQQPSHRALHGITSIDHAFLLISCVSPLRCIEQELTHIT